MKSLTSCFIKEYSRKSYFTAFHRQAHYSAGIGLHLHHNKSCGKTWRRGSQHNYSKKIIAVFSNKMMRNNHYNSLELPRENGISKADDSLLLLTTMKVIIGYCKHQEIIYMVAHVELHQHNNTEMVRTY